MKNLDAQNFQYSSILSFALPPWFQNSTNNYSVANNISTRAGYQTFRDHVELIPLQNK